MEPKDLENEGRDPEEEGAAQGQERDWLGDHPELAPDESRISVDNEDPNKASIRRTANTGDIVETQSRGELHQPELGFERDSDYMGSEASVAETEEGTRGSGALPGKLWGEDAIGAHSGEEDLPALTEGQGFDPSVQQVRNRRSAEPGTSGSSNVDPDALRTQGRDLGDRPQVTGSQAFGRDIGVSGLPNDRILAGEGQDRPRPVRRSSDWTAVLGRLGGSSPGSEENLQLAEKFAAVHFPATPDEVLRCLPAVTEFRVRTVAVDLREAVSESRARSFGSLYDLIDAVKDEIRRAEKRVAQAS